VAEWSNAAALKAADRVSPVRGFESLPLRFSLGLRMPERPRACAALLIFRLGAPMNNG
jgi:hypothetical protein